VRKECRVVRELLERTARVSSGAESRGVVEHAAACPECRQLLLSYQRLDEVLAQEGSRLRARVEGSPWRRERFLVQLKAFPRTRQKVLLQPAWVGTAAIVLVAFGAAALYLLPKGKETDHRFSPMVTAESAQRAASLAVREIAAPPGRHGAQTLEAGITSVRPASLVPEFLEHVEKTSAAALDSLTPDIPEERSNL